MTLHSRSRYYYHGCKFINISFSEEGTFGVPFELLMERTGIESNLGAGPSRLRIPSFVEDSLSVLKQMGM